MVTEISRARVDERALGAGTTLRFVLLVVLLLVSSTSMMTRVVSGLSTEGSLGCMFATGADPNHGTDVANFVAMETQRDVYLACVARYAPLLPWWVIFLVPVLLVAATGVLFWTLPRWRERRAWVVPLEEVDGGGEIWRALAKSAAVAGLDRVPRVVVDRTAVSTSAVVFGSNRRPTVCLHWGLLARRTTHEDGFRAVLLHELAHIRNRDVTLTYVTIAMWRVFLAGVLLPYVAWQIWVAATNLTSVNWPSQAPSVVRGLLLAVFVVVLVYLARSDVLRSREIYADLAAARWGARYGWTGTTPESAGGPLRRGVAAFAELWRSHPRWELRRGSLTDPAVLFSVGALPMFLTGAAAALVNSQVSGDLSLHGEWVQQAAVVAAAALAAGVAGSALWRAVAHAVLTERPVPSSVPGGLALGAGLTVGGLEGVTWLQFLPADPEVYLLVIAAGLVFAWWVTQCAQVWATAWRGRTLRPVMLLVLAAGWLVLTAWFMWWEGSGEVYATGMPVSVPENPMSALTGFSGSAADHRTELSVIAAAIPVLSGLDQPLIRFGAAALWVVPLLAWTIRPSTATPRWVHAALRDADDSVRVGETLPPLRRMLLTGTLGGLSCWVAVAGVMAYMHSWQQSDQRHTGLYILTFVWWVIAVLPATAAATALAGSVRAAPRYQLFIALVTAQIATLIGLAGVGVLVLLDGCLQPLNTLASTCHWRPSTARAFLSLLLTFGPVFVLSAISAAVVAALVALREKDQGKPRSQETATAPDKSGKERGDRDGLMVARRFSVGVLCVAAVWTAVLGSAGEGSGSSDHDPPLSLLPRTSTVVSAQTRTLQVNSWYHYGGRELMARFNADFRRLRTILSKPHSPVDAAFAPPCADIRQVVLDAGDYFVVPDTQAQSAWQTFLVQAGKGGKDCENGVRRKSRYLLHTSFGELNKARAALVSMDARITEVRRIGGV